MRHAIRNVHFVGIGGAGMSGIAEVLHAMGHVVSGSDAAAGEATQRLSALGVSVHIGHSAAHVGAAQAVVTSSAVGADNPEVREAQARGIPVVPRAVMLAELMRPRTGIAIAGTHGKTTTTSLVASVLLEAGVDPSFVIGGQLRSAGVHARLGAGPHIVVEADESDASFLHLLPMLAVVTNIDADHMETYGHDPARLADAFVDFLHRMPFYGTAVLCADDPGVQAILPRLSRPRVTYGVGEDAMVRALDIQALEGGRMRFDCRRRDDRGTLPDLPVTLNLAGRHNVLNALAAVAIAAELELPDAAVQRALRDFGGVGRRFQRHGDLPVQPPGEGCFTLVDDYGHHPVEMAAVLAAARGAFPGRRLVLAFQPHRYTRTRDCLDGFADAVQQADVLLLTEVYAAGEPPIAGADGRALHAAVLARGGIPSRFVGGVEALPQAIAGEARDHDVVITMGAGSIAAVAPQLVGQLGVVA